MIYTFYSNHYEWLQEALFKNIYKELGDLQVKLSQGNLEDIFNQIPVICSSAAVEDKLSRTLVDKDPNATNPGVEFKSIFEWVESLVEPDQQPDSQSSELVWKIWHILNTKYKGQKGNQGNGTVYKRFKRLCDYVDASDKRQLLDFSIRLSNLYINYVSSKAPWLLNWVDEKRFPLEEKLEKELGVSESSTQTVKYLDYCWQKELWKDIVDSNKYKDTEIKKLLDLIKSTDEIKLTEKKKEEVRGKTFHLFIPFSIPPLVLPLIKYFAKNDDATLRLYILNPIKPSQQIDEETKQYLIRNTATIEDVLEHRLHIGEIDKGVSCNPGEKLKFQNSAFSQSEYLPNEDNTYLHKFQNAILFGNSKLLPSKANEDDKSLKVFKAPSFIRELEGIVDWIHYRLREDKSLRLSDILVVVPDIKKTTAEIESVMEGLPKELSLEYKIIGRSVIDSELTVQAIIGLGKLLNSPFYKEDFLEWLELPINQKKWNLSLSDITILGNWLDAAGFCQGLSNDHLKFIKGNEYDEDYSLDCAIERLATGYLVHPSDRRIYGDIAPIFKVNFDKVSDEGGRLLKTLISISELMKSSWIDMIHPSRNAGGGINRSPSLETEISNPKEDGTPEEWRITINRWIREFFDLPNTPKELISFRSIFKKTIESMVKDAKVPFDALWVLLENKFQTSSGHIEQKGAVTFAPISAVRGLPSRVVIAAGFNEESGFPGRPNPDEFDLLGEKDLCRPEDYDSSDDKKAQFLDLLLAARDHLILSYTAGTDVVQQINPSTVIENFKEYFLSQARDLDQTGKTAKEIWEIVEVLIPLNSFSKGNFKTTKSKKWTSPREETYEALKSAGESNKLNSDEIFVDRELSFERVKCLPARVLMDFFNNPEEYTTKRFGLPYERKSKSYYGETASPWLPDSSPLPKAIRLKNIFDDLSKLLIKDQPNVSFSGKDIFLRGEHDPSYGIRSIRKYESEKEVNSINNVLERCKEHLRGRKRQTESIEVPLPEEIQGITSIVDRSNDFYIFNRDSDVGLGEDPNDIEKKHPILVLPVNSQSARTRAHIKHLIWHAWCKNKYEEDLESILIAPETFQPKEVAKPETNSEKLETLIFSENLEYEDVISLIKALVKLFSLAREHGISICDGQPQELLWQGIDEARVSRITTKTEEFTELRKKFFAVDANTNRCGANVKELLDSAEELYETVKKDLEEIHKNG